MTWERVSEGGPDGRARQKFASIPKLSFLPVFVHIA